MLDDLSLALRGCPSDYYVLASQPGVHSTDFSSRSAAPRLGAKMTGKDRDIRSKMIVSEVMGALEAKQIQDVLERECGAQTTVVDGSCKFCPLDRVSFLRVLLIGLFSGIVSL